MRNVTVILFLMIGIIIGMIFFQIFLSKKENKWYGLVLPIISFLFSLISVANVATPISYMSSNNSLAETGLAGIIFPMVATFLISNIPTVILLVIYFACREKRRVNKELDKMRIDDL